MTQPDTIGEGWQDIAAKRAKALASLSYLPGTWDKRFTRDVAAIVAAGRELTEKQAQNVERLAWKYRRQLPARLIPNPPASATDAPYPGRGHSTSPRTSSEGE
jgi:hypothetical protein